MGTDVSVQIPPGSVPDLEQAAHWHAELADTLRQGRQTLVSTNFKLATAWEGVAAQAYSEYSQHVSASYGDAAEQAEEISHRLAGWARELAADQHHSRLLLGEAERIAAAIDRARQALGADPADRSAAATRIAALEAELAHLERRAARVYEEAERFAASHNAYLSSIAVTPPALLHTPAVTPAAPVAAPPSPAPAAAVPVAAGAAALGGAALGGGLSGAGGGQPASANPTAGLGAPTSVPADLSPVSSGATQGAISFGDLEKIGRQYGWSASQDQAWWRVIELESGGNPAATNVSSGAYGIGQFLGPTLHEYAAYGAASANPMDQLNAMARYISDRYGSPGAALSFHLAHNWY